MHNPQFRCYGRKCDGQCPQFQIALQELEDRTNQFNLGISEVVKTYEKIHTPCGSFSINTRH